MAGQAIVTIQDKQWQCAVANTPQELVGGLSGVESIPPGTGMLFDMGWDYPVIDIYTDEMLFPLDIIFINSIYGVVEVLRNVNPGDEALFQGEQGARFFLEIIAGEAEGIEVGDGVLIQPGEGEEIPTAPSWITGMVGLAGFMTMGVFMVGIVRDLTSKAFEEPEGKPAFLPHASPKKAAIYYEVETDRMGNIIITRSDDPGKDVFLQFEADKCLVYDLLRKGEKKDLDAGWEVKVKRSEPRASTLDELWERAAQSRKLPQTKKQDKQTSRKPDRSNVSVDSWAERDRLGIWLTDRRTGKTVAEWWDEDAREMFEQGWFKQGDVRHQTITGRAFENSVLDYAESVGLLAGGKYLAQTVKDACYWTAVNKDTGEIAESFVPYTSSGRAMASARAFVHRHWEGHDARLEVWRKPHAYSEKTGEKPIATELLLAHRIASAVIPTEPGKPRPGKGELEFLPDSPEFLAYTIDDIGYREKIDSAFLGAIARAKGGR